MKITLKENDGCFAFGLTAETLEDAALLVRFGTNRTDQINSAEIIAHEDGSFSGHLVIGKNKRASGYIQRRR